MSSCLLICVSHQSAERLHSIELSEKLQGSNQKLQILEYKRTNAIIGEDESKIEFLNLGKKNDFPYHK
jgi:hypothetical protein